MVKCKMHTRTHTPGLEFLAGPAAAGEQVVAQQA